MWSGIAHRGRPVRRVTSLPLVRPKLPPPEALERFRVPLKERAGYRWVAEIYRRHRRP
jgi:hypothetical protein